MWYVCDMYIGLLVISFVFKRIKKDFKASVHFATMMPLHGNYDGEIGCKHALRIRLLIDLDHPNMAQRNYQLIQ